MATIFKVWRQIENPTPSIDVCLLEEHSSCQISSRSDSKRRSLRFSEDSRPNKNENKMSNDVMCDQLLIQNSI